MTLHLTVDAAGVLSLWDSEAAAYALRADDEVYVPLILTDAQIQSVSAAATIARATDRTQ